MQAQAVLRGINVIHRGLNHIRRHDKKAKLAEISKNTKRGVWR